MPTAQRALFRHEHDRVTLLTDGGAQEESSNDSDAQPLRRSLQRRGAMTRAFIRVRALIINLACATH
jgi:hypothetical protein